jgi:hypothetical protein
MKQDDMKIAQSQARTWTLVSEIKSEIKAMRAADESELV